MLEANTAISSCIGMKGGANVCSKCNKPAKYSNASSRMTVQIKAMISLEYIQSKESREDSFIAVVVVIVVEVV